MLKLMSAMLTFMYLYFPVFQGLCGLPITTYFSAVKLRWLLDNSPKVAEAARQGRCLFGTVDSWLLWVSIISACNSNLYYMTFWLL